MNRNRLLIGIIVGLVLIVFAMNSNALNLQGYFKKPNESGAITSTDEQRPVVRRRGAPSDGGAVYAGQGQRRRTATSEPGEYVEYESELPGVGQRTKGGPGSAYMDQWYSAHPEALVDANGNAAQIGSGRPAEVPGLPSLAEIERRRQQ